jgi:UDP-N-acetylmuramoylalanine--D-glutamate ligase
MTLQDLDGKKIGILGFGQEGQAVKYYLSKHHLQAVSFDNLGEEWPEEVFKCQVLFRSPGVRRNHPQIQKAEQNGTIITSQVKWFFDHSPAKIIGVTGTKGKGTTCSFIYQNLQSQGLNAYLTGNIGKIQPLEFLDQLTADDIVVYELSSFQLQDLTKSPHIGICLMVTSDHLDHHANLQEYHHAKSAITAFQKHDNYAIYNIDYEATRMIGQKGEGYKLQISASTKPADGAFIQGNLIHINFELSGQPVTHILDCQDRKLKGAHNLENIAAGSLASLLAGVNFQTIEKTVREFTGLEHRLQFVREVNGVEFYNDSISTIPETTAAALNAFEKPINLLLGGSDKGLDYSSLINSFKARENLASITLLGVVGEKLSPEILKLTGIKVLGPFSDFEKAMTETINQAKPGEIVLLSPGAASFDMFKSYTDRGEQFVKIVNNL